MTGERAYLQVNALDDGFPLSQSKLFHLYCRGHYCGDHCNSCCGGKPGSARSRIFITSGGTMPCMNKKSSTAPEVLREAMATWLAAQQQAVDMMASATQPGHPVDWAEGYRWVTRIAAIAQEYAIEYSDPLRPVIFHSQGPTRKLMVDNPDVNYYFVHLDDQETYCLTGERGDAAVIGLTVGTDIMKGVTSGPAGTLVQVQLDDFEIDSDGHFEIIVSKNKQTGNWLALPDGAAQIAVRETFHDRSREQPAQFHIERIGPALPPEDITPDITAQRINLAAHYMLFIADMCIQMWQGFSQSVNVITGGSGQDNVDSQDELKSHSAADMAYMGGAWKLEPGQGLRVTIHPARGGAPYWGIVLISPWMESYEFRQRQVCTNNGLAAANPDGSWTLVIAAEDPGAPYWLDTGGRREGYALIRWVLPASLPPTPTCELIEL